MTDQTQSPPAAPAAPPSALSLKLGVAIASLLTTVALTVGKLTVGSLTGSLALVSDGLQGLIDIIVTMLTVTFILLAARGACAAWTAGRYRLEAMAALAEAALLALIGFCIWYLALQKFVHGHHVAEIEAWHLALVAAAAGVDGVRALIVGRVARATGSLALEANAAHFRTDAVGTGIVLAGLGLAHMGWPIADSVATVGLAALLLRTAWRVGHRAATILLDIADPADSLAVLAALESDPEVRDVPLLRLHRRPEGYDVVGEVHLAVPSMVPSGQTAAAAERLETLVRAAVPAAAVVLMARPKPA